MSNNPEKRIINSCQTCRTPIYEGEPIYTSSKGQSSGYTKGGYAGGSYGGGYAGHYSGVHASESWAQCAWCYDQWQAEIAANKSFWIKWWLGGIFLAIIATVISIFVFPGLEQKSGDTQSNPPPEVPWHRIKIFALGSTNVSLIAPLILLVSLFLVSILGKFFQPSVNRYRLRRRPTKLQK